MLNKTFIRICVLVLSLSTTTACIPRNFYVPSGSMEPNLHVGDIIMGWMGIYDFNTRMPQRGDIVLVQIQPPNLIYVMRLIGLPGDRVQMKNGVLKLNKTPVQLEDIGEVSIPEVASRPVKLQRETLPNGVSYNILDLGTIPQPDNTKEYLVPAKHYFIMGDNRDNANDSRFGAGYVPQNKIIGQARFILWRAADGFAERSFFLAPDTSSADKR